MEVFLGIDAQVLSFGAYPYYDAPAPESDTYGTIRQLSSAKTGYKLAWMLKLIHENLGFKPITKILLSSLDG